LAHVVSGWACDSRRDLDGDPASFSCDDSHVASNLKLQNPKLKKNRKEDVFNPQKSCSVVAMSIEPMKDGLRSHVRIDFYGNVHKRMRGSGVEERYAKEVEVLKVLEERGCPYVPKVLEEHPEDFYFVSTNCGRPAPQLSKEKADKLYAALEKDYGVRHLDAEPRNITYSDKLGRFCIIDFELAEILPNPHPEGKQ